MRICHICSGFPPTVGGTETHNYSIVKYLSERGYDVEVIVIRDKIELLKKKGYSKEIIDEIQKKEYTLPELKNVRIYNMSYPKPIIGYYQIWKKVREIEKKHGKIDVIDVHTYPFAIPFSKKRKIILSLHFWELLCPKSPPQPCRLSKSINNCSKCVGISRYIYWELSRNFSLKKISKIIVKYNFIKEKIIEEGIDENTLVLIPHWLEIDKIRKESKNKYNNLVKNIKNDDFVFGVLGRLDSFNGVINILKAFNLLRRDHSNIKLLLIGDGILKNELITYTIKNNINDRVIFTGNVNHDDVTKYLSMTDACVNASPHHNYNWSLLEIMCSKKPLIATNVDGTSDILKNGYNALLCKPDSLSIKNQMKTILKDKKLANEIAENAYNTVAERHSMKNLEQYERLIQSL